MNKLAPMLLAALLAGGVAHASDSSLSQVDEAPSAGAMAFDLLLVRPLGLVTTVLGTGIFILQLPFDFGSENNKSKAFDTLVVEPARYTFTRELGSTE
jgi:hypothetical protein